MRKKIVAGNWKMNLLFDEADALFGKLQEAAPSRKGDVGVIIAPPAIYLQAWAHKRLDLAAQDCSAHESGAYTGELSAAQLKSIGVHYSLVGHSERRSYHGETSGLLAEKVKQCLAHGVTPIFCFGEELAQREQGQEEATVAAQLSEALFDLSEQDFSRIILAYEPVWAIGTGKTASAEQAQEIHAYVRGLIRIKYNSDCAENTTILYGGSCKPSNADELFACPDVDGGLIGGAALKANDFEAIIKARG